MQRRGSRAMTPLRTVVLGLTTCAGVVGCLSDLLSTSPSQLNGQGNALSVPEVAGNPDAYVNQRIRVFGRLHVQPRPLEDAVPDQPARPGAEEYPATLHLVFPDQPTGRFNLLNLYRSTRDGQYEPLSCLIRAGSLVNCGDYKHGSLVTIAGTWVRHQVPSGQAGNTVFAWRTIYFLVAN